MKTKPIPHYPHLFYSIATEHKAVLPTFVFPSVWFEHRRQGLEVSVLRVTFAWWRYRCHVHFGKTTPPSNGWNATEYGLKEFVSWGASWSKNAWPEVAWSQNALDKWLQQSDWKTLVRWGGAKYHYGRIILAKEFLVSQSSTNSSADALVSGLVSELPELDLPVLESKAKNHIDAASSPRSSKQQSEKQ